MIGYKGSDGGLEAADSALIADLADAVHNIPSSLVSGNSDIEFLTEIMLKEFDQNHPRDDKFGLYEAYKHELSML